MFRDKLGTVEKKLRNWNVLELFLIMTIFAKTSLTDWTPNAITNAMLKPVSKITITVFMLQISTLDLSALTFMMSRLDLMTVMNMQPVLIYDSYTCECGAGFNTIGNGHDVNHCEDRDERNDGLKATLSRSKQKQLSRSGNSSL